MADIHLEALRSLFEVFSAIFNWPSYVFGFYEWHYAGNAKVQCLNQNGEIQFVNALHMHLSVVNGVLVTNTDVFNKRNIHSALRIFFESP
jgi:hypothetical protein